MHRRMRRQLPWLLLCVALAGLLAWLGFAWQPATDNSATQSHNDAELPAGGDFTLYDADGPVSLADYRGKVVVVYFGYTFCPDICPTSLALLSQALTLLSADELARVASLMISVDPERDTSEVLKIYAPFFHPSIRGISGTEQQVAQVAALYDVRYMRQKANADGLYSVDHSAYTYVIGADGKLAARLAHGTPPDTIVRTLRTLLARAK